VGPLLDDSTDWLSVAFSDWNTIITGSNTGDNCVVYHQSVRVPYFQGSGRDVFSLMMAESS